MKERVRRVVKKLAGSEAGTLANDTGQKQDRGFRVFKLAESNFQGWDAEKAASADALAEQLEMHIDHIRQGRTEEDILSELLLKSGFPLTVPVEKLSLAGKTVFSIGGGVLLVCLDRALNLDVIRAMADLKPSRVVCLDAGFSGNDQLKTNAVQTFKTKGVANFRRCKASL